MDNEDRKALTMKKLGIERGKVANLEVIREGVQELYRAASDYTSEYADGSQLHQELLQTQVFTASLMQRLERHNEVICAEVRLLESVLDGPKEVIKAEVDTHTIELELP